MEATDLISSRMAAAFIAGGLLQEAFLTSHTSPSSVHEFVCSWDQHFPYLNVLVGPLGTLLACRFRLRRSRGPRVGITRTLPGAAPCWCEAPRAGSAGEQPLPAQASLRLFLGCLGPFSAFPVHGESGWSPALSCPASRHAPVPTTLPTV